MGRRTLGCITLGLVVLTALLVYLAMSWTINSFISLPELLAQNTCRLPCWRGITPGRTSIAAALDTLAADPTIKKEVSYEEGYESVGYRMIFERQRIGPMTIENQAIGNLIFKDGRVRSVLLVPEFFPLAELLKLFGPPDQVLVMEQECCGQHGEIEPGYHTALFYLKRGIKVRVWTPMQEEAHVDRTHMRLDFSLSTTQEVELFPSAAGLELEDVMYQWYSSDATWSLSYADAVSWAPRLQPWAGEGPYRVTGETDVWYFP